MPAKKNYFPDRSRNWRSIDAKHRRRGELLTVWLDPEGGVFAAPPKTGKRGRPKLYSDALVEAAFVVKALTGFSLRALEGFLAGMAALTGNRWRVPDYSTLSLRERTLEVDLGAKLVAGKRHVLMVDSTGLKAFGEGEWKVRCVCMAPSAAAPGARCICSSTMLRRIDDAQAEVAHRRAPLRTHVRASDSRGAHPAQGAQRPQCVYLEAADRLRLVGRAHRTLGPALRNTAGIKPRYLDR